MQKKDLKKRLIDNAANNKISMSCMVINTIESFSIVKWPIDIKFYNKNEGILVFKDK
jgi:hypothetical protein